MIGQALRPVAEFASASSAKIQLARRQMLVLVDDLQGVGASAVVMAAQFAEPEAVEFLTAYVHEPLCVAMPAARLAQLEIAPVAEDGQHAVGLGVDARMLATPGRSVRDRAATVRLLADPLAQPVDFAASGHVLPVAAHPHGVLERPGLAEAAVDLCRLAGLRPAALLCGLGRPGEVASPAEIFDFATRHELRIITIADVLADRLHSERLVERAVQTALPVNGHPWQAIGYAEPATHREHMALVLGDVRDTPGVLACIHSRCLLGDVFGSTRCGCGQRLDLAMRMIEEEGRGAVVYLRSDVEHSHAVGPPYAGREHAVAMQILAELGVDRMRLIVTAPPCAGDGECTPPSDPRKPS